MNVDKINAWIRTDIAAILGFAACIWIVVGVLIWWTERDTGTGYPPECYGVYGSSGRFYPSSQVPYFSGGLWYVITHDDWHAVGDFEATFTDRQCLRDKYPDDPEMVPDVEGVDR